MPAKKPTPSEKPSKSSSEKQQPARSTEAVVEERVTLVLEMLADGMGPTAIWEASKGKELNWGVSLRQIDNYIAKANEWLKEEVAEDRRLLLKLNARKLRRLHSRAVAKGDLGVALNALKEENKLFGLHAPTRLEHTVTRKSFEDWLRDLPDTDLRRLEAMGEDVLLAEYDRACPMPDARLV